MSKKIVNDKKNLHPDMIKIAKKLKQSRKEKGFTSYENFAIEFDISRMQYWRMEKGTNFNFQSLLKILGAHKISLSDFFKDFK